MAYRSVKVTLDVEITIPDFISELIDDYTLAQAVQSNLSFEGYGSIDWDDYVTMDKGEVNYCDVRDVEPA